MAALVDFTALTPATGWTDGFPICASTPVDGIATDYWRKVRLDFSKTNLATTDWAKIMVIPAHTYVHEILVHILTLDAAAAALEFGDTAGDGAVEWLATCVGTSANVTYTTLVADTNGATRGKFYHTAGALYLSPTGAFTTLAVDVYVHCMNLDPL